MSCLDVMYQVYGPPQPYFAAAYTPYHQVRVSRPTRLPHTPAHASKTSGAPRLFQHRWYSKVLRASARVPCVGKEACSSRM